jgi:hypothetical protein
VSTIQPPEVRDAVSGPDANHEVPVSIITRASSGR